LVLQGFSDILKVQDKHEFLKRMHKLVMLKINGSDVGKSDVNKIKTDVAQLAEERKPSADQKRMLKQLRSIQKLPAHVRIEIKNFILNDTKIELSILNDIKKYRQEIIDTWPKRLGKFILESIEKDFDYANYWEGEDLDTEIKNDEIKEDLLNDFAIASRRVQLDSQIVYDIQNMIDGKKDGFRRETLNWLRGFLKGTIPKIWSDKLVEFLRERFKQID